MRAAIAPDDLAITIDASSSLLAAARTPNRPPATRSVAADHHSAHQQAKRGRPANDAQPQPGRIEHGLRSLHITEPAMLLRAAAIADAASDLLAIVSASSRDRDSLNDPEPRRIRQAASRAAKMAARDIPTGPAGPGSCVWLETHGAVTAPDRTTQTVPQNSRNYSPAN